MEQRGIGQGASQWYLIARHGDMVMRVRSGMPLGETAAGELSFDPSCAQVELDLADDGGLVLSAVHDHELESAGGTRRHCERLVLDRRANIRLPHNVLQLDTDFVDPEQADEAVEIRAVRSTEDIAEPQIVRFPDVLPDEPAPAGIPVVPTPPIHPSDWHADEVDVISTEARTARTGARRQRIRSPLALVALAGIGVALLYPVLRESSPPGPSDTVGVGADTRAPLAVTEGAGSGTDVLSSTAPVPTKPLRLAPLDAPAVAAPDDHEEAERPGEQLREPGPPSAPTDEPVVLPTVEQSPTPLVAQRVDAAEEVAEPEKRDETTRAAGAEQSRPRGLPEPVVLPPVERPSVPRAAQIVRSGEAATGPEPNHGEPEASVVPELETSRQTTPGPAAEVARQRALFAADQALAQGQLTTPPEANAYALYNRVLALDPGSAEARSGLQAVRQALINRALAELAGNALEDARKSLNAAADAGADPMLVANLRNEVDYRQRLIDARAGDDE